jgi:hypothetical protein
MASASDLNQPNNIDFKGDIQKIVTEFKDIISNKIKKDTLSNDEKAKVCELFKWLCDHFFLVARTTSYCTYCFLFAQLLLCL